MKNIKHLAVVVSELPTCDFCNNTAEVDGKTVFGSWAYMCRRCFKQHSIGLGLGKGQKLLRACQIRP